MKRIFLVLPVLILVAGCSDATKGPAAGQKIERSKSRKMEMERREKEFELFAKMYREAAASGKAKRASEIREEYLEKQRQYKLMDKLDEVQATEEDIQSTQQQMEIRR